MNINNIWNHHLANLYHCHSLSFPTTQRTPGSWKKTGENVNSRTTSPRLILRLHAYQWWTWMYHAGYLYTLPETNSSPLKIDGWKMYFLLGMTIFRDYVSFRECIYLMIIFQTCTASSSKNPREPSSVLFLGHPTFLHPSCTLALARQWILGHFWRFQLDDGKTRALAEHQLGENYKLRLSTFEINNYTPGN